MHETRVRLRGFADAWTGPVDGGGCDAHDAGVLDRGDGSLAGSRGDLFRPGGMVRGGDGDDLGIAPQDLLRGQLRIRARRARRDVLPAGDLDEVVDVRPGPYGEDLRRIGRVDLVIDARLGRRGRRLGSHGIDTLLEV